MPTGNLIALKTAHVTRIRPVVGSLGTVFRDALLDFMEIHALIAALLTVINEVVTVALVNATGASMAIREINAKKVILKFTLSAVFTNLAVNTYLIYATSVDAMCHILYINKCSWVNETYTISEKLSHTIHDGK